MRVARESAVKSRSVATIQLGDLIVTAPSELREQLATRKTLKGKASLCRRLRPELQPLVATAAPRTTALPGISTGHASQLLVTAGQNITRLHSEAAFAALCGASPIPVASGKRGRYRLNPGGDRQANRALHMIAVCRPSLRPQDPRLRPTPHRRRQDQK